MLRALVERVQTHLLKQKRAWRQAPLTHRYEELSPPPPHGHAQDGSSLEQIQVHDFTHLDEQQEEDEEESTDAGSSFMKAEPADGDDTGIQTKGERIRVPRSRLIRTKRSPRDYHRPRPIDTASHWYEEDREVNDQEMHARWPQPPIMHYAPEESWQYRRERPRYRQRVVLEEDDDFALPAPTAAPTATYPPQRVSPRYIHRRKPRTIDSVRFSSQNRAHSGLDADTIAADSLNRPNHNSKSTKRQAGTCAQSFDVSDDEIDEMEYQTAANTAPMCSRYPPPHDVPSDYDSTEEHDGSEHRYGRLKRPYYVPRRGMMRERAPVMYYPPRRRPRTLSGHYVYEDYLTEDEEEEIWRREQEEMEHGYAYYPRYRKLSSTQPLMIHKRYIDGAVRIRPPRDRSQSPTLSGYKRRRKEAVAGGSQEDASEHSNQDTTIHKRDDYDPGDHNDHNAETEEHCSIYEPFTSITLTGVEDPVHAAELKNGSSDIVNAHRNRPRSTSPVPLERENAIGQTETNVLSEPHADIPMAESTESRDDDQPLTSSNQDDLNSDGSVAFSSVALSSSSLAVEIAHTEEQVTEMNNSDVSDSQHHRLSSVTSAVDFEAVDNEATPSYSIEPCDAEFEVTMQSAENVSKQVIKQGDSVKVVDVVKNDAIRANCLLIASLERTNRVVGEWITLQQKVKSREQSYHLRSNEHHLLQQLRRVCIIVNDLQLWIVGLPGSFSQSVKTSMVFRLDAALEQVSLSKKSVAEKLQSLHREVDSVIASLTTEAERTKPKSTQPSSEVMATERDEPASSEEDNSCELPQFDDDKWEISDEEHHNMGLSDSDQDPNHPFMIAPKQETIKLESREPRMKSNLASVPLEVPTYLTSFLTQVEACDPSSFAMKGMQKRLLGEIVKMNPYYYLQSGKGSNAEGNPSSSVSPCEFGCRGGSAVKWERKVISQISSRMKWFDSIAYSLAKTNGSNGKELLTRKKLNSTIRKLHLVAMQLHCLVSHLYCLRGRSSCKELDSLPVALNNSQHERRMNGYKSRLKLVVNQLQQNGSAPEELLRDTYEFFPELLVCIDIWGHDFRESKRNANSGSNHKTNWDSIVLPLGFFAAVEGDQFDYEQDANGYLQGICDELLNIVCLWNDFKWGESFDSMPVDRIVAFEADVKKSVQNILDSHAHHLLALWSNRLMEDPDQLAAFRLTQHNVYYVDNSHARSLVGKPVDQVAERVQMPRGSPLDLSLVQEYWKQKLASDAALIQASHAGSLATPLSPKSIAQWPRNIMATHLMKWSQVFALRSESQVLSSVMSKMLQNDFLSTKVGATSANRKANAGDLLASVRRARIVASDCVLASDKLSLHFAASQLNDSENADSEAASGSSSVELAPEGSSPSQPSGISDNQPQPVEVNGTTEANRSPDRPDIKELVTILTSTRKEVDTLHTQRIRSARVRLKLQSQSIQLAEQSLALLRNIAHNQQLQQHVESG